jgi:uncharacterized protein
VTVAAVATIRRLSVDAARRTALSAQGFTRPRPSGRVDRRHVRSVLDRLGALQVDSVNVLVRSHELPLFSRLGPYPRDLVAAAVDGGEMFEYWAHMASILPVGQYPLWRWRMATYETSDGFWGFGRLKPGVRENVLEQVRARGPLTVGDVEGRVRNPGTWWDWDETKRALESLFAAGVVGATRRQKDFARRYDLIERIIPERVRAIPPPAEPEARRELLRIAARALGVGTLADLADYFRFPMTACKPIVEDLVTAGELVPVEVDGWAKAAFLHADAVTPRRVEGQALLSPFDSLVWFRDRTARLFDFHLRIEIYVPAPKRVYGYYVLPFLLDGELAGRVDLKADRAGRVLRVQAAHVEADLDTALDRPFVAERMLPELAAMAGWLDLETVAARRRGNLADDLLAAGLDELA